MERRDVMKLLGGGAVLAAAGPAFGLPPRSTAFGGPDFAAAIRAAQARTGGRLGVSVLDLATGARFAQRGGERFAMCSTFKFLLSAGILAAVDAGRLTLDRAVAIPRGTLPPNSPATKRAQGGTMTVAALCRATVTQSDNAAANLLLGLTGGVDGFNGFARRLGDSVTRLDRHEPELNTAIHGDARDTTTPDAMLASMDAALFGPVLTPRSRALLVTWLVANTTGGTRLRAGLPRGWRVGDKTGTGENGTANDIGVIWPRAGRRPILVTSYLTAATVPQAGQNAAHAAVGRAIAAAVA